MNDSILKAGIKILKLMCVGEYTKPIQSICLVNLWAKHMLMQQQQFENAKLPKYFMQLWRIKKLPCNQ